MPRIQPIDPQQAEGKAKALLDGAQKSLGTVPNLFKTMANSPAVLGAYLGMHQALSGGSLSGALREQIALAVAGVNGCDYCASAHNAIGEKLGVDETERAANLRGASADHKTQAALDFARAIVQRQGWVSDEQLQAVRDAGYSEGEVAEIVAAVVQNIFSNYFNHIADTEIDFPFVSSKPEATAGANA